MAEVYEGNAMDLNTHAYDEDCVVTGVSNVLGCVRTDFKSEQPIALARLCRSKNALLT